MIAGDIAGIVFLPVSVILFLNTFGVTSFGSLFGFSLLLLAAIGIILIEAGDIFDAHVKGESVWLIWITGILLMLPAFVFFASLFITLPPPLSANLPVIMASFLFVEGLSSFFIGN
ncbi:hypothetical protein HYU13_01505 [Candidatus Woesearchaeota archaeon]|nr:hypothetical protein [Candidatus Woesearchaeota archaeon]